MSELPVLTPKLALFLDAVDAVSTKMTNPVFVHAPGNPPNAFIAAQLEQRGLAIRELADCPSKQCFVADERGDGFRSMERIA